jgi:hypothetical protein
MVHRRLPSAGITRADRYTIFYAPDVLRIRHAADALAATTLYVGDGATIKRPIMRIERQSGVAVGHASITTQLDWCARMGVRRAMFTHCGRAIVAGPPEVEGEIAALGRARRIRTSVASDGMRIMVR